MEQEFEAPPMSGGNLPLKELKSDQITKQSGKAKHRKLFLLITGIVVFSIFLGIMIGFLIKKRNNQVVLPSPSSNQPKPSITSVDLPLPPDLKGKMDNFKKNLNEVDLKESNLNPPALDYKIRFKLEK